MHAAVFFSLFGVQTDPKIVGTGRWVFPSANSPRSFFSELEIHQKEGSPFGGQGRQDPTVAIPESPRLSLFDDYGVASDFVNVSPALELRGFTRDSGSGGASGGFPGAQGIWKGNPPLREPFHPDGVPEGVFQCTKTDCKDCRPTRSTVMPDKYDRSGSWLDFITHFKTIAELNFWDGEGMAKFLTVTL